MANAQPEGALAFGLADVAARPLEDAASQAARSAAEPSAALRRRQFWALWEAELPRLREVASHWTRRNLQDVSDVLSQASIRSCEAFEREPAAIEDFGRWSRRVVKHAAIDLLRDQARHHRSDPLELGLSHAAWEARVSGETVHRQCSAREEVRRSIVRIAALPERLFAVAAPCFVYGVSYEETAQRLGLPIDNVRKRVQHARELLRDAAPEATPDRACVAQSIRKILDVQAPVASEEGPVRAWLVDCGRKGDARYHLSFGRISTKRYQQRRASLDAYVAEHPRGWKKRWQLAELLFAHGAWEAAASHYLALLGVATLSSQVAQRICMRLLEMAVVGRRPDWAQRLCERAARGMVDPALRSLLPSYELLARGALLPRSLCSTPALEGDRRDCPSALARARLYELAGEHTLAWETYRAAEVHPHDIELLTRRLHLALVIGRLGPWIEAQIATLLADDPNNPVARCAMIRLDPNPSSAAREAARLIRQYAGWALPRLCLARRVAAPRPRGLRAMPPSARPRGAVAGDPYRSL